jgi:RNA polymerase sigma-70 factor, ECF subfamily
MSGQTCCRTTQVFVEALDSLRWLAQRWTRTAADAEDLIQDTAERAFRNAGRYASGTNATAWVRSIMYHLAIDGSRRASSRRIRPVDGEQCPDPSGVEGPNTTEEDLSWRDVELADVQWAADRLAEPVRGTFQLWMRERLNYGEISRRQRIPMGTVASRLLRGRGAIREILASGGSGHTSTCPSTEAGCRAPSPAP